MKESIKARGKNFFCESNGVFFVVVVALVGGWVEFGVFPSPFSKWRRERGRFVNGCMY